MYDEKDLNGLSDEERNAINDEQDESEEQEQEASTNTEEGAGDDSESGNDEQRAGEPGPEAGSDTGELTKADLRAASEERKPFVPQYKAEVPENADERLEQIKAEQKALRQKFSDGEIDLDEYEDSRDRLSDEQLTIKSNLLKAQIAQEHTAQALQAYWESEKAEFLRREENKVYSNNYAMAALNTAIGDLARKPENANQPASYFLREGDRIVREGMGIAAAPKRATQSRSKNIELPPDLGRAPSAELPETGEDHEFSHLDKLSGLELERALAKMSEEQETRYLRMH